MHESFLVGFFFRLNYMYFSAALCFKLESLKLHAAPDSADIYIKIKLKKQESMEYILETRTLDPCWFRRSPKRALKFDHMADRLGQITKRLPYPNFLKPNQHMSHICM